MTSPNWSGLDIPTRTVAHSTQMLPLRVHFEAGEPACMRVRDSQIARAHRPPAGSKKLQPLEFPMGGALEGRFSCVRLACILHQCCGTGAICTCDPTPWEGVGRRPNQTKRRFGAALKRGAKRLCFSPLGAWLHAGRATCGLAQVKLICSPSFTSRQGATPQRSESGLLQNTWRSWRLGEENRKSAQPDAKTCPLRPGGSARSKTVTEFPTLV